VGNSRGARKLARTPHVNQKKKKKESLHRFEVILVVYKELMDRLGETGDEYTQCEVDYIKNCALLMTPVSIHFS
jgi:hypothetical protein